MKAKLSLTTLLFILFQSMNAQHTILIGKIFDETQNKPIEKAHIYVENQKIGTISDINGNFNLDLKKPLKNSDFIKFSMLGYETKLIKYKSINSQNFVIYLKRKYEELDEVIVKSKLNLNTKLGYKELAKLPQKIANTSSIIIKNKIYVFAGNTSQFEEGGKRAMDEVQMANVGSFRQFINIWNRRSASNATLERYSDKIQVYDIKNGSWSVSNLKLRKRAFHKAVKVNDKVFVLGGKRLSTHGRKVFLDDKIEVLDISNKKVTIDKTNPHQAINFAAFSYKNSIITIGGSSRINKNNQKEFNNAVSMLNTKTGLWYELTKMPIPSETNGILVKDKIYLIGGLKHKPLNNIYSYNLISGKWNLEGELFSGVENAAVTYKEDTIFIYDFGKIITYNINTKALNQYNINLFVTDANLQYHKNKLYLFGGFKENKIDYIKTSSSSLYEIDVLNFSKTKIIKSKTL